MKYFKEWAKIRKIPFSLRDIPYRVGVWKFEVSGFEIPQTVNFQTINCKLPEIR